MPERLIFAEPVVEGIDDSAKMATVRFGLLDPSLSGRAVHYVDLPNTGELLAAIKAYASHAHAELMGAIEGQFPGEYSLDAPTAAPERVSMSGARLALRRAGLLPAVEAVLADISDPGEREDARIIWEYAATIERGHALVRLLSGPLGLTETQIDELFTLAASL